MFFGKNLVIMALMSKSSAFQSQIENQILSSYQNDIEQESLSAKLQILQELEDQEQKNYDCIPYKETQAQLFLRLWKLCWIDSPEKKLNQDYNWNEVSQIYAYGRQGFEGDVQGNKPGLLYPLKRQTFEAWEKLKGTDIEIARQKFLEMAVPVLKQQNVDIVDPNKAQIEKIFNECLQMKIDSGEITQEEAEKQKENIDQQLNDFDREDDSDKKSEEPDNTLHLVAIFTTVTIGLALILWIVIYFVSKKNKNENKLNQEHSNAFSQSSLKTAATALKKPINESNDKSTDGYDSDYNQSLDKKRFP